MKITFTHAAPANLQENAQTVKLAMEAGASSLENAVRMLHAGDDWTEESVRREVERIEGAPARALETD